MRRFVLFLIIFSISFTISSYGDHDVHDHHDKEDAKVGIEEKLGNLIPNDLVFTDSNGKKVKISDLIKKAPTVILPVYYTCPNVCNILQSSFANIIPQIKLRHGIDYQVISVSFDELDTPEIAKNKKINYMATLRDIPTDSWIFLTGDKDNIKRFMDAIGFKFKRQGKDFIHGVTTVIISKDGKIVRYLYGTRLLPFDLNMALIEAQKGEVGLSVKRILTYCFSYDSKNKKYAFNFMRVSATLILGTIVLYFIILLFSGKKKKMRGKDEP